jgi:UDPglucose 6-dehydrogenase
VLAARLIGEGADVAGYDPIVSQQQASGVLPRGIDLTVTALDAARGADAVVIVTEWPEFVTPFGDGSLLAVMRTPLVIDGRNLLDPVAVRAAGFTYEGVGRGDSRRGPG